MLSSLVKARRRRNRFASRQRGFTLIEVMVVVVILSILAAVVVPRIMDNPDKARVVKAKQDIRVIKNQLDLYRLHNFRYPTTEQGLEALVQKPADAQRWQEGGYLDRLPKDPWNKPYQYLNPGQHAQIDIYSLGADGQAGGEGVDADIGNWNLDD
ncbi:MAG TPA: type II secretion system major pseudopilin GspG [Candidatus Competibacter sp.]|nr:type II secretion system protein GspG [Candidatus Competibacteraceae bacterium]HUM95039.1 type II secretion system major pseudopilin GspG [Candidatus Competibacter sp.]